MATEFVVIQSVRQRFGDGESSLGEKAMELESPFVGMAKDYPFECPDVDTSQAGILQLESLGIKAEDGDEVHRNILRINGFDVPGGLTPGPIIMIYPHGNRRFPIWKSHTLIIPEGVLQPSNVLHIEATLETVGPNVRPDNFIIDNVVLWYKLGRRRPGHTRPINT